MSVPITSVFETSWHPLEFCYLLDNISPVTLAFKQSAHNKQAGNFVLSIKSESDFTLSFAAIIGFEIGSKLV